MKKISAFKIFLFKIPNPFELELAQEVLRINGCDSLNPVRFNVVDADPFLFVHHNELFLFYESVRWGKKGVIKMIHTKDLKHWSKPIVVLSETCHLSYPFVFFDSNTNGIYMIPETCALNEIRIYKADNNNLTKFSYYSTLLKEVEKISDCSFSDSSIWNINGIYFLHTTRLINGIYNLELYVAENLMGPYSKHPSSPIIENMKFGRNGGSLFTLDGKIYRPAMNCEEGYGDGLGLFEIDKLTKNEYSEHLISENLLNKSLNCYKDGGHHYNIVKFKKEFIVSTDARSWKTFLIRRIIDKLF